MSRDKTQFFSKRFFKKLLPIPMVVGLIAAFYGFEHLRGKSDWKSYRAKLEAGGQKFELKDVIPANIPDDHNFATTPLFHSLFDSYKTKTGPGKFDFQIQQRNASAVEKVTRITSVFPSRPGPVPWMEGRKLTLQKAETTSEVAAAKQKDTLKDLGQWKVAMDEIEAAVERPGSRFPIFYEDNINARLPHLSVLRAFSTAFCFRSIHRLESGDVEGAFRDTMTLLRLAQTLKDEPILLSQVVRITMFQWAIQPIWEGMEMRAWNASQLSEISEALKKFQFLESCALAFRGERGFNHDLIFKMSQGTIGFSDLTHITGSGSNDSGSHEKFLDNIIPSGWFYQNLVNTHRAYHESIFPSFDPKLNRIYGEKVKAFETYPQHVLQKQLRPYVLIAGKLLPALTAPLLKHGQAQTSAQLAIIACELEKHRMKHQKYPESLSDLFPAESSITRDVMDGKPLRCKFIENGFLLYSIGQNEIDDGGQFEDTKAGLGKTGDWVLKMVPAK